MRAAGTPKKLLPVRVRLVRDTTLAELRAHLVHHAATLFVLTLKDDELRRLRARVGQQSRLLDAATDDLTVARLRRTRAVDLLQAIDTAELPAAAAAQIRAACEALERGGEEGPG
ncbi:hypothetical protein ACH4FX_37205 [Streptomyces sp. NPDC018019]|uniref:hypothetical protein n=1 Tax=Streptomyces sp. NPDC018019 TaxID=3365030 RepID=UPI0037A43A95